MKTIFTLILFVVVVKHSHSQVILNEIYTDPSASNHEFFELYNTSTSSSPYSVNNITIVTYFHIGSTKGFYVMDLPNMTITPHGYFVGASASPFNYQGTSNSNAVDFSWNSAAFTSNQGSIKKWDLSAINLVDGNLFYDQAALPVNFNDFFYRITGTGASYTVFLYDNGQLVNSFIGGTGGMNTVTSEITSMPNLFVDMAGTSTDFTINFSGYGTLPVELCTNEAGNDNGYIRQYDGACGSWIKSSSGSQHTPRASNGTLIGPASGSVSVSVATWMGNATTGSQLNNDIVAAPSSFFPIKLEIYTDLGTSTGRLDPGDVYVTTNTENVLSDGPFYTHFFPYNAQLLVAVKTNAGCYDKILYVPNVILLSAKLTAFTVAKNEKELVFQWTMENNEMVDKFELQKSLDGIDYTSAGYVFTTEKQGKENYQFKTAEGNGLYRLRIFNKTGKVDYSNAIRIAAEQKDNNCLQVLNNPVKESLNLLFNSGTNEPIVVRSVDMNGRIIIQQAIQVNKGSNVLSLPLPSTIIHGMYMVSVIQGNEKYSSKFIY